MCKFGNKLSRDVLIDRANLFFSKNVIYYTIVSYSIRRSLIFLISFSYPTTVVLTQLREIPVPIPNTEVKPHLVDDTGMISAGKVD